jgi:methyl coenzyme M reductase beta subunit
MIKIDDIVDVTDGRGIIIATNVKVTNISPCKQWVQTSAGLAYMPATQILSYESAGTNQHSSARTGTGSLQSN